ncbi:hypothetical protein C5S29_06290 [ANME-1 cluster archaeon GoMg3.2]|nr:hypothetical protein [ANME-1 cluster archaeon GoMg3.2]
MIVVQVIYTEIVETLAVICDGLQHSLSLYTPNTSSFFLCVYIGAPIYFINVLLYT